MMAGYAAIHLAAGTLIAPAQHSVGPPPADLPTEDVELTSDSGTTLRGWYIEGTPGQGSVLLLHGIRADRRSMLGRARFLHELGYATLLIDLQAHGESEGTHITAGVRESADARAAIRYLRERHPGEPLAAIGVSLGGAALLLGDGAPEVDALVLEAVYPDLCQAIRTRLRIRGGAAAAWFEPLLTWELGRRLGIDADDVRPVDRIGEVTEPVMIIAGELDRRTTLAESRAFFEAAGAERKEMWVV